MENTFTKKLIPLLFVMTIMITAGLRAQNSREISGNVTNGEGITMPGVTILEKGTTNGTVTDVDGNYSFIVSENAVTLVFSFVGMETKEIIIGNQSKINVSLDGDTADLEEVVVVGYGEQRKATLTGAIASTDEKMLKKSPVTSLSNSLSGLLPGLTTLNRSGEPGQNNAQIFIRGRSTTGNTSPLIVIDGVPDETGAWQRINQNDIEQVSILKDASASIYGARAANGVILITTKRGSVGKPVFSYTFNQGITQPTRLPEMANSWEFADYVNQYRTTIQNLPALYSDQEIQTMRDGTDPLNYPNTDWVGTIFKKFTPQSMNNLNVRGGTEKARYSMSGSYIDENSIVKNGSHESNAFTLRTNVDVDITDNFRFGLDLNGEMDNRKRPVLGGFGTEGSPLIPAFYPNGLPASLPGDAGENPAINLAGEGGYFSDNIYRTFVKPSFNLNIPQVEGLSLDGYVSYRQEYTEGKRWRDTWLVYNYDAANDEFLEKQGGQVSQPDLQEVFNKQKDYLMHFKIKYSKAFGDHLLETFAAFEQAEGEFRTMTAYRRGFISSSIEELFAGSGENMVADGTRRQWGRQNVFGRINYNYEEKYLFETNLRYDGSYAFPQSGRWGFFPGFSAGWRISEEDFLKSSPNVDNLKLRASYGQMGNDQINPFQFMSMYNLNPIGTHFGGGTQAVLYPGVAPNEAITWEVSENANVGLDATLWRGGLDLSLDFFKQRRSNILTARSTEVPIYTGLVLPDENIGIIENQGFEVSLTHGNNVSPSNGFSYTLSGNMGYAKNTIVDISEPQDMPSYQKAEGNMIGTQLLYESIGIFRTQEEVDSNPIMANTQVGDLQYRDVNEDGTINAADRVRQNKGVIPEITFGFNTSLAYKRFSLFANFAGQARAWTYFHKHARTTQNSLRELLLNRYTPGSMDSKYPILPQEDGAGEGEVSGMPSTFWLQNASFLRLKTLQVDYSVPEELLSKFKLSSLMLFVNGSNLFTLSDIKWFDPEGTPEASSHAGFSYSTGNFYPQTRVFNIGLNVTF
ncbi:TonB-dependent receptor [uncultured Cyclobacterium sp.]|uniref:SusC/RagA family TonB-linked outer membrane protein n=1 Tax=uncultured Cyclobacterium sp. TaxID=453820 RepID=UPI0030ECC0AB|tara:strand:- start:54464 stop:57547 length:3084 start_codon:yes stop_codon:yes gene_type:complete